MENILLRRAKTLAERVPGDAGRAYASAVDMIREHGGVVITVEPTEGRSVDVAVTSYRQMIRLIKPIGRDAAVRYFRRLHRRNRSHIAAHRGDYYVAAGETVYCEYGHPVGRIRANLSQPKEMQTFIPYSAVEILLGGTTPARWPRDKEVRCAYCGVTAGPKDGRWRLEDGLR